MAESVASPRMDADPSGTIPRSVESRTPDDSVGRVEHDAVGLEAARPYPPGTILELPPVHYLGRAIERRLVVTHIVQPKEDLETVVTRYLLPHIRPGDIALIGQKLSSVCQGRCVPLQEVRVRPLARALSRTVRRTPHGLGLRRPETMEMALREVGTLKILHASLYGAWDRVRGTSGSFYRIAGSRVWAIDGPGPDTIEPYDQYIVLAPEDPDRVCREIARRLGVPACIVDVNDLAAVVLGASPGVNRDLVSHALADNPMGQGRAQTPLGVLHPYGSAHTAA